jgi:NAD(P)-dependent dehydrogenase (short-subunit alcohol dehydrogenase family)
VSALRPDLNGRVALVSGAAQGMGASHARRLAASGARVAVNDREDSDRLSALAAELGGIAVAGDLADPQAAQDVVARVSEGLGAPDILVANHAYMTMSPFLEADLDDWWRVVDTNLGGAMALVNAVLPGMIEKGAGRIVIITSEWGVIGWPEATAYSASKAALISLTKTLGRELAPRGVVVNAIAPGVIDTPQLEVDALAEGVDLETMKLRYGGDIPVGRIGRPEEISETVAFLCDFRLSAMIGQVVQVNGASTRSRA